MTEKPTLLSGGNPQIPKGEGDASVQAYIAAMPGWKRAVGERVDALVEHAVPEVKKAVKWNSPFYGVEGQGWFFSYHCFTKYVKLTFFRGGSLDPRPPGKSKHEEVRYLDVRENEPLDEKQLTDWITQAAAIPRMDDVTEPSPSELIDRKIAGLGDWRGETLAKLRALIREADPDVVETVKWRKPSNPAGVPVWEHAGIVCTGESYKDKIKLTFAHGAALADPKHLFNASLEGNTRRALDLFESDEIDAEAFKALFREAAAFNEAKPKR